MKTQFKQASQFLLLWLNIWVYGTLQAQDTPRLIIDPYGHASMVREVIFTADGQSLISLSDDKTIRIWNIQNGEITKTIRGQVGEGSEGKLYAGTLSPDGKYLAVGGWTAYNNDKEYGRIRLINLTKGEIDYILTGHTDVVNTLDFSADGKYLVSGSADKSLRVWKVDDGEPELLAVLKEHTGSIQHVKFLNSKKVVSVSYDGTGIIWDWSNNRVDKKLERHTDRVSALDCSPNGQYIATGGYDNLVMLWDEKGNYIKTLTEMEGSVYTLSFSSNSEKLVVHGTRGVTAKVFSVPSGTEISSFDKHDNTVVSSDFFKNELVATAGGDDNDIYIWEANTGKLKQHMVGRGYTKRSVAFARQGLKIAFGNTWGGRNGEGPLEMTFDFGKMELDEQEPLSSNYQKATTSYQGEELEFVDKLNLKIPGGATISPSESSDGWLRSYTFTPEGNVITGNNYTLKMYDQQGEELKEFIGHTGEVWALSISKDGSLLATAGGDQTLRIWSLEEEGEVVSVAETYTHPSWVDIWRKNQWVKLAEEKSKEAWLKITEKLGKINYQKDSTTIRNYYEKYIKNRSTEIKPLLTLFIASDQEWVGWTPQGYYAASTGGEKYIGWHINQGINKLGAYYPLATFRKKYYKPELVQLILEMGSFEAALQEYNQDQGQDIVHENIMSNLPPKIEWITPEASDTEVKGNKYIVKARVTSDVEINQVKLLVNGRTVSNQRGFDVVSADSPTEKNINYEVTLTAPENVLSIFAANQNSAILSEERLLKLSPQTIESQTSGQDMDLPTDMVNFGFKPNLYLISVGVSDFEESDYNLDFADDDAEAISKIFKTQEGKLFKSVQTKVLTNEQATRANILDAFYWLEENTTQNDMAMIFIASHGFNERDKFYILPHDGKHERLRATGVDWADFQDVLGNLPSKVVLFLDACHSGQLASNLNTRGIEVNTMEAIREITSAEHGVVVLSASTGNEKSLENKEWNHGAFTLALVRALKEKKADMDQDGIVYLRELDFFVAEEVKNLTRGKQHPTTQKPSTISRLPLFQVR